MLLELATVAAIFPKLSETEASLSQFKKITNLDKKVAFITDIVLKNTLTLADKRIWAEETHVLATLYSDKGNRAKSFTLYLLAIEILIENTTCELSQDDQANIMHSYKAASSIKPIKIDTKKFIKTKTLENSLSDSISQFKHYTALPTCGMDINAEVAETIADKYIDVALATEDPDKKQEYLNQAEIYYLFVKKHQPKYRLEIDLSLLHIYSHKRDMGVTGAKQAHDILLDDIPVQYINHPEVVEYNQKLVQQ